MSVTIRASNLKKNFGEVRAVKDVSFEVNRGEVFGFLGPNGAGKTTTIGMLLGLIYPTAGEVEILGERVTPNHTAVLRRVGALVGASPSILPYLGARGNLEIIASLSPGIDRARIDEVLSLIKLEEDANRKSRKYSTGMKQRLGLGMALYHKPDILILDEPTNGMDPSGMREVRHLLCGLASEGTTVFLSSHLLHEVEQVCDRVAILNKGDIVAMGKVSDLLSGHNRVRVKVRDIDAAADLLGKAEGVQSLVRDDVQITVTGLENEAVVRLLAQHELYPSEVTSPDSDLESLFIELTENAAQ